MEQEDWPAVRVIYQDGIETGQATFETAVPSWADWDASKLPSCRFVARLRGVVVGWTALSPVSRREVYAGIAEVSIYMASGARGQGLGRALLQALVESSEQAGYWMLQAVMFPENEASVALHTACGFRVVGKRELVACHRGIWRDTILMERRSRIVGV